MRRKRGVISLVAIFAATAVLWVLAGLTPAQAQTETVLYSFRDADSGDGGQPYAGLVKRSNFYGTTVNGGAYGAGTVYRVTAKGKETVFYSFGSQSGDGLNPYAGLVKDKTGNLYGTTFWGGAYGAGTVYRVTAKGKETVLYSFGSQSGDEYFPFGGLVMDKTGNLYGTTGVGGAYNLGMVYKVTPAGTETVLHSFQSQSGDGYYPYAGLVMDKTGNLYGTTYGGGAYGEGTVYKVAPAGTETVLYSFGSQAGDGANPFAGFIMDKKGNLYGTTDWGGTYGAGTVYKVTPAGTETILYSFGSQSGDGANPQACLVMDKTGNLYGTTYGGGAYGSGTVYKVTPAGIGTVLYSFGSQPGDGETPVAGLVMDKTGNLYGTTANGGAHGAGTVFKLMP